MTLFCRNPEARDYTVYINGKLAREGWVIASEEFQEVVYQTFPPNWFPEDGLPPEERISGRVEILPRLQRRLDL